MKKKRLNFEELKVKSFITNFEKSDNLRLRGGDIIIVTNAGQGCATAFCGSDNCQSGNCDYSENCIWPTRAGDATCEGNNTTNCPPEHPSFYC